MISDKNELLKSIQSLCQDMDRHRCMIASFLEVQGSEEHSSPRLSREFRLKTAIRNAIEELEESRKSFKSKRLEALRRQLTRVLAENE